MKEIPRTIHLRAAVAFALAVTCCLTSPARSSDFAATDLNPSTAVDSVWLTADTAWAGDTASLILYLANPDSAVASISLWIKSGSPDIMFDTAFPLSPRFPVAGMEWAVAQHDSSDTVSILIVDFQGTTVIPPGHGPIMELRYTIHPCAANGTVPVDTAAPEGIPALSLSYPSGLQIPEVLFLPGSVTVEGGHAQANIGDVSCDGVITAADIIMLVNHVFKGAPAPECGL